MAHWHGTRCNRLTTRAFGFTDSPSKPRVAVTFGMAHGMAHVPLPALRVRGVNGRIYQW
jgi:hypothetical protein